MMVKIVSLSLNTIDYEKLEQLKERKIKTIDVFRRGLAEYLKEIEIKIELE